MADTSTDTAAADYLAAIRSALADLPAAEVGEIMDDIGPQVAEVAAELGPEGQPGALHERLGTPQQYAAELRAAAGYPAAAVPASVAPSLAAPRLALWLLVAVTVVLPLLAPPVISARFTFEGLFLLMVLAACVAGLALLIAVRGTTGQDGVAAVGELPEVRWLRSRNPGGIVAEYARLLQPGWWLVRAGIAATMVVYVFGAGGGGLGAILLFTVPLAIGSIWVGRRSQADRRWLWAVLPLNAFALAVGLLIMSHANGGYWYGYDGYRGPYPEVVTPRFGNVYPYDSNGRPLNGVYLYDQSGQPITSDYYHQACQPAGRIPVPANQFPQPEYDYDNTGQCVVRSAVPTPSGLPPVSADGSARGTATSEVPPSGTPSPVGPSTSATAPTSTN